MFVMAKLFIALGFRHDLHSSSFYPGERQGEAHPHS